jgi:hypothetical protein
MKNKSCLFFALGLLFTGCSTIYTIKDYPSKEKFHEDINNSIKDEKIKVVLLNDSSFTVKKGSVLENDTLFVYGELNKTEHLSLALSNLKKTNFRTDDDFNSVFVLLNDPEKLNYKNIKINCDSIYFDIFQYLPISFALSDLVKLNYVNKNDYKSVYAQCKNGEEYYGENAFIKGDSTYFDLIKNIHISAALSDIIKFNYADTNKSSDILGIIDEECNCDNLITMADTIYFDITKTIKTRDNIISINKVKTISYKTRLETAMLGVLAGGFIGAGVIYLILSSQTPHTYDNLAGLSSIGDGVIGAIGGVITGAFTGGFTGAIIGYDYIYQFNENL